MDQLLSSKDMNDNMRAYYLIGEQRDTSYIPVLIRNLDDNRISHHYRYKGMSVYQAKINALVKVSGELPPNRITYLPDSVNIRFYEEWIKRKGYD